MGLELTSSGGNINLELMPDFSADLDLKASAGKITSEFEIEENTLKPSHVSSIIQGKINGGGEKLICQTGGGNIIIKKLNDYE